MTVATFERTRQIKGSPAIDVWCELRGKTTTGADTIYRFSQRVLSYPAGSILPPITDERLGTMSQPSFELSDGRRGQLIGVSMTINIVDDDYLVHNWLDNPFQDNFLALQLTIWAIPEDQRRAAILPVPIFRGVVRKPRFLADRVVQLTVEDPFTSTFPDNVPFYEVSKDQFPNAPKESLGTTISPCYGDLTDGGVTTAAPVLQSESISGSKVSPDHIVDTNDRAGYATQGGDIPTATSIVEVPTSSGSFAPWYNDRFYAMARITDIATGITGDPENLLPRNCPSIGAVAADSTIVVSCANAGAGKSYSFYLARIFNNIIYWEQRLDSATPTATFTKQDEGIGIPPTFADKTPGAATTDLPSDVPSRTVGFAIRARVTGGYTAFSLPLFSIPGGYGRIARFAVSPVIGALDYQAIATRDGIGGGTVALSDWNRQFVVPTSSTNGAGDIVFEYDFRETTGSSISGIDAPPVAGIVPGVDVGPCIDLNGITWQRFLFSHGDVKEISAGYLNGVMLDESRYGVDVLLPDKTGFDQISATRTIDIGGYTFITGYLRSTALDSFIGADSPSFTTTLLGVTDGSGNLLTAILDQIVHVANNFTLTKTPYVLGSWLGDAVFPDGTVIIDLASVATVKARLDAIIPSGQAGAWFYRQSVTAQQLHAEGHISGGFDGSYQPSGQYRVALWERTATPSRSFSETFDIVAGSFSVDPDFDQLETVIDYTCKYNMLENQYDQSDTYTYAPGVSKYGRKKLQGGEIVNFRFRRQIAPCTEMASLRAQRYGSGPFVLAVFDIIGFHSLNVLSGHCIALDHSDGPWSNRATRVQSMAPNADGHTISFVVEDYRQASGLVGIEDIMAERSLGGSRENSCHTVGGIVRPWDWRPARINGSLVPASYIRTARLWISTDAGSVLAKIYDDLSNLIATAGSGVTSSSLTLVEIILPYDAGVVNYEIRLTLTGGATDLGTLCFGRIDVEP